jgi:polysaccharide biosynthesis transport protein
MSSDLGRYPSNGSPSPCPPPGNFGGRSASGHSPEPVEVIPWQRYLSALKRYKWLVLLIGFGGTIAGFLATRLLRPQYEVHATIWVATESREGRNSGPIRAQEMLQGASWVDLLKSYKVLDRVVLNLKLFVGAADADLPLFANADIDQPRVRPDGYELVVDDKGHQYTLINSAKKQVEAGTVGDSIGRTIGLKWQPSADGLSAQRRVKFWLMTPRQAASGLQGKLYASLPPQSSLLRAQLTGGNPQRAAAILNAVTEEFLNAAAELKEHNVREFSRLLGEQLQYAERELRDGEIALENFRVSTITLPAEGTPVAGGAEITLNPIFDAFFRLKLQEDSVSHDREALERTLAGVQQGKLGVEALWSVIGPVGGSPELRTALTEYATKEAALRTAQQLYTDEHKTVRELKEGMQRLSGSVIPRLANSQISQLRQRQLDLQGRITGSAKDLRAIPTRTIEEMRLRQNVETRKALYLKLKDRYEEARLAEASLAPDLTILDAASPPQWPAANTARRIMAMAMVASFGFALVFAILIDRLDPRFRYIDQATKDLGLSILGVVPKIARGSATRRDPLADAQLIESFRSLRLNVQYALPASGPIILTVTSPGPSDGKSLVCANLALAFADAGYNTLLIDGDIRRGTLHTIFDVERTPGLIDHLRGAATTEQIIRSTRNKNLSLIPCGQRHSRGPEALVSPELPRLVQELQRRFDAIFIDSAPLGAGIDGFALSATTGSVIIVLRPGATDRQLAKAKLDVLDRLPTTVLGAVVNDVKIGGMYRYYAYAGKDAIQSDDVTAVLPSGDGTGVFTLEN